MGGRLIGTVAKGIGAHLLQIGRQLHICQAGTFVEAVIADGGYCVGDRDIRQILAVVERVVAQGGDGIGDDIGALVGCGTENEGCLALVEQNALFVHRIFGIVRMDRKANHAGAIFQCVGGDAGDALGQLIRAFVGIGADQQFRAFLVVEHAGCIVGVSGIGRIHLEAGQTYALRKSRNRAGSHLGRDIGHTVETGRTQFHGFAGLITENTGGRMGELGVSLLHVNTGQSVAIGESIGSVRGDRCRQCAGPGIGTGADDQLGLRLIVQQAFCGTGVFFVILGHQDPGDALDVGECIGAHCSDRRGNIAFTHVYAGQRDQISLIFVVKDTLIVQGILGLLRQLKGFQAVALIEGRGMNVADRLGNIDRLQRRTFIECIGGNSRHRRADFDLCDLMPVIIPGGGLRRRITGHISGTGDLQKAAHRIKSPGRLLAAGTTDLAAGGTDVVFISVAANSRLGRHNQSQHQHQHAKQRTDHRKNSFHATFHPFLRKIVLNYMITNFSRFFKKIPVFPLTNKKRLSPKG